MGDRTSAGFTLAISSAMAAINEIHNILFGGAAPSDASVETLLGWSADGDSEGFISFRIDELNYANDPDNFSALAALGVPFWVWHASGDNYDSGEFNFGYDQESGMYNCLEEKDVTAYELLELINKASSLEQVKKDIAALKNKYERNWELQRQLDEHKQKNANGQYFVAVDVIQELSKKPEVA